ncbi:Na+/H+ antiporter NhaC family protein [Maribacter sp. HTCC2170]|uniref:Na+/H+ antiporter NhaC family protein n=1 Tax=Maribacter sp. (strain HTCC2170 / KCCM 42371) TaxID=313603 RepID=UPI0005A06496|nr:Na+/H+ antiporter NhaC family protein [Maribacter sp. HTCC2170]
MKLDSKKEGMLPLKFYGGVLGALVPFLIFVAGVIYIALSGAPDERGFWPVLLFSISVGLILSKDRNGFSETIISGMSQKIVMIMITAWILASIIGILMTLTGFVEALIWASNLLSLNGIGFVIATFIICCIVSLSTGSSFATILICSPLLYPTGGILGSHLPTLAGAIIGGAAFGDFIAPISDTTIASALSQKAKIGKTVKSRIKYVLPATLLALVCYILSAYWFRTPGQIDQEVLSGDPKGLPMLLVPIFIIYLFLKGRHLLHGLLLGLLFGTVLGLCLGLLPWTQVISLDLENFAAKSFIIDGINRALGISIFTILLMGLVATLKASGLMGILVDFAAERTKTEKQAEGWISVVMSMAVLLTTHSIVAILMVTEFTKETGGKLGVPKIRRANLLSLIACIFPFILPYFIPVILMSNMTNTGKEFGLPQISPFQVGLFNFMSLALLIVAIITIIFGVGRRKKKMNNG